jgi:hypothetical protein
MKKINQIKKKNNRKNKNKNCNIRKLNFLVEIVEIMLRQKLIDKNKFERGYRAQ